MRREKYLFSAIVAAYDIEAYISTCMDTLLEIPNDELEIIVVIGNETDHTNDICRAYADGKKIKVVRQTGKGLSNARNCGMDAAEGTYILFIDGDDSVRPQELKTFLDESAKMIANKKVDIILNDFYFSSAEGKTLIENEQIHTECEPFLDNQYTGKVVTANGTFWNAWRFLFSQNYLRQRGFRFKENSVCEDLEFAVRVMLGTDHIWFCHIPYYNYCPIREGSLSNQKNPKMVQDFLSIQSELRAILRDSDVWYAYLIINKLDELLILNLPDLFEVDKSRRTEIAVKYKQFLRQEKFSDRIIYKLFFLLCRTDGIYLVSILLFYMKKLRRKKRYKV